MEKQIHVISNNEIETMLLGTGMTRQINYMLIRDQVTFKPSQYENYVILISNDESKPLARLAKIINKVCKSNITIKDLQEIKEMQKITPFTPMKFDPPPPYELPNQSSIDNSNSDANKTEGNNIEPYKPKIEKPSHQVQISKNTANPLIEKSSTQEQQNLINIAINPKTEVDSPKQEQPTDKVIQPNTSEEVAQKSENNQQSKPVEIEKPEEEKKETPLIINTEAEGPKPETIPPTKSEITETPVEETKEVQENSQENNLADLGDLFSENFENPAASNSQTTTTEENKESVAPKLEDLIKKKDPPAPVPLDQNKQPNNSKLEIKPQIKTELNKEDSSEDWDSNTDEDTFTPPDFDLKIKDDKIKVLSSQKYYQEFINHIAQKLGTDLNDLSNLRKVVFL